MLSDIISAVQRALGVTVDGAAGPQTWAAIHAKICGSTPEAPQVWPGAAEGITLDARSEKCIATLHPKVQAYARHLVQEAGAKGINVRIISGLRTYDEQTALYAQGRSAPGQIVTNARAGYSNHNFGIAFDIGIFQRGQYLEESPLYKAVAAIGMSLGLVWGGSWKTIQDEPHYQLRPAWAKDLSESAMLLELRRRKSAGIDYFA